MQRTAFAAGAHLAEVRADGTYKLPMRPYGEVSKEWPQRGRWIIGSFTEKAVCVYQAYNHTIADYALEHQKFAGCPAFNEGRMTWFKTNFLWMMYRCGFAEKDANQVRVLAVWLRRESFDEIISQATTSPKSGVIRVQWDPDYTPELQKVSQRRDIQIGVKGRPSYANGDDIVRIEDVTHLAKHCKESHEVPVESMYLPDSEAIREHLRIGDFTDEELASQ